MDKTMGINFDYTNFISSYGMQQIPKVDSAESRIPDQAENQPGRQAESKPFDNAAFDGPKAPRTANLEDVSLTFNKQDDFGTIGKDVDIAKLDMEKVVSDSKRGSILSDYQRFVGPTPEQMVAEYEDGLVIAKN